MVKVTATRPDNSTSSVATRTAGGGRRGAPAALRDAQLGAISFPQRFGSSLNPHYHYHLLALDGVVSGDLERGVQFHEATGLEARLVYRLPEPDVHGR